MSERTLKLIENKQLQTRRTNEVNKRPYQKPHLVSISTKNGSQVSQNLPPKSDINRPQPEAGNPHSAFPNPHSEIDITPAEAAEVARFKALTAARAAQQAMIERIMAELDDLDAIPPAA